MQPGMVALSTAAALESTTVGQQLRRALSASGIDAPDVYEGPDLVVAAWGGLTSGPHDATLLTRGARHHERDLTNADIARAVCDEDLRFLSEVLPPFAAVVRTGAAEVAAVVDALGFRHLYHAQQPGWAAVSTSAALLAVLSGAGIDREAVAVQSLLGWQLGQQTLHSGVSKLGAGSFCRLRRGRLELTQVEPPRVREHALEPAVEDASAMLREYLTAYVEDHPDARLQLTGGQDSRILLSAVPHELRPRLIAVTLKVPGSPDAAIAGDLAARCGMRHEVVEVEHAGGMEPEGAFALCLASSVRLDGMADPLAMAALTLAERQMEQGHRISGLGGEVARGFYYVGPARDLAVTPRRVARLAAWRMFANESVEPEALVPELQADAHAVTLRRIHDLMSATGRSWLDATDDFYLEQRMQRWAGVTDTAVSFDRSVVNPMLDDRFISIARGLPPRAKHRSLFLARLQLALDEELGALPLDGRPAPTAYARPSLRNRAREAATLARKATRKVSQRARRTTRPPAGGVVLRDLVVQHLRDNPGLLEPAHRSGIFEESWLERVASGALTPAPSSTALLVNVLALPLPDRGEGVRIRAGQ